MPRTLVSLLPLLFLLLLTAPVALGAEPAPATGKSADPYRGKVAVITGTSSGLGLALARLAADKGMQLVLADINFMPSKALAAEIEAHGGAAVAVEVDLAKADQRARVIDTAMKRYGRIDYLFNNAGYNYMATLQQMDLAEAHRLFEVNYWAYLDLAQRAIPIMKKQGGGTIVNIASVLGHSPGSPGLVQYAGSKHALVGALETAARELAPDNIRVRIASPGGMRTNIGRNSVGPLADQNRDRADNWEAPEVVARDIFTMMLGDQVTFVPGSAGRARQSSQPGTAPSQPRTQPPLTQPQR